MISDSVPWREELWRVAQRLRKRTVQQRWTERTSYLVERDLMTGMYAIRRLIESGKCSSRLPKRRLPVQVCKMTGSEPDLLDRWTPWEHYDLDNARRAELGAWFLLQQFIHSYIFMLDFARDTEELIGVFVGSDTAKKSHLYRVRIMTIIDLFEYVGIEDVVHAAQYKLDGSTLRFTISQHDLVEAGLAEYENESRELVRHFDSTDDAVRRAFPELNEYRVTQFRPPSWSDHSEHLPEV